MLQGRKPSANNKLCEVFAGEGSCKKLHLFSRIISDHISVLLVEQTCSTLSTGKHSPGLSASLTDDHVHSGFIDFDVTFFAGIFASSEQSIQIL